MSASDYSFVSAPAASTKAICAAHDAEYVDAFPVKGEAFHPNEIAAEMMAEIITGVHNQQQARRTAQTHRSSN